ncbi:hypothetical protein [Andreprevotia chitinilytica]|uniref:hypothetical protein n=1 Tax=Andreprevotia chitinilytica TaxID=396808 RepID=UPI000555A571|nr:hypothetical protein [Andreprevotia chitinilytica]
MTHWEAALQHAEDLNIAARKHARQALETAKRDRLAARRQRDTKAEVDARLREARHHWETNQFPSALTQARAALRLLRQQERPVPETHAWQLVAQTLQAQGRLTNSLQSWLKSLALASERNDLPALCESYLGIGGLFLLENDPARAELAFRYAYDLATDAGHTEYHCKTGLYLLSALTELDRVQQAQEVLARIGPVISAHPNWSQASHCDYRLYLGANLLARGELDAAEQALRCAMQISRDHGLLWGHTRASELVGQLRGRQGRLVEAAQAIGAAINMAAYFDPGFVLQRLYSRLADIKTELGDFAGALAAHELYHDYRIRLLRDNRQRARLFDSRSARNVEMELHLHKMRQESRRLQALKDAASQPTHDVLTGFGWWGRNQSWPERRRPEHNAAQQGLLLVVARNLWEINLQLGQEHGDALLARLAGLLRQRFPDASGLRFGGSVLAIQVDTEALAARSALAADMLALPAQLAWPADAPPAGLTLAAGAALPGESLEAQLRRLLIEAREPAQ